MALKRVCKDILVALEFQLPHCTESLRRSEATAGPGADHTWAPGLRHRAGPAMATCAPGPALRPSRSRPRPAEPLSAPIRHLIPLLINGETQA